MKIYGDFTTSVDRALSEIDPKYKKYDGLIVAGTHEPKKIEETLQVIKEAREQGIPTLLICHGYQMGAVEYARNVMGIGDAVSEEWGTGTFVIKKRPELKVGLHKGESWWSNYEVDIQWSWPDWFIATPYHPEYESSKLRPHPLLVSFIDLCRNGSAV